MAPALHSAHQQDTTVLVATEVVVHELLPQHGGDGGLVLVVHAPTVQLLHWCQTARVVLTRGDAEDQLGHDIGSSGLLCGRVI